MTSETPEIPRKRKVKKRTYTLGEARELELKILDERAIPRKIGMPVMDMELSAINDQIKVVAEWIAMMTYKFKCFKVTFEMRQGFQHNIILEDDDRGWGHEGQRGEDASDRNHLVYTIHIGEELNQIITDSETLPYGRALGGLFGYGACHQPLLFLEFLKAHLKALKKRRDFLSSLSNMESPSSVFQRMVQDLIR
jgi:hypothetical protein